MALFLPTMTREGCKSEGADSILQSSRWLPECVVLYFCSLPSRSGLFIRKIVLVLKFYFPGKGSWHSVLIKKPFSTQCERYLSACSALCLKVKFFPLPRTTAPKIPLCAVRPVDTPPGRRTFPLLLLDTFFTKSASPTSVARTQ